MTNDDDVTSVMESGHVSYYLGKGIYDRILLYATNG